MNVLVNIFWDGIIAFNHFDWVDKLCGNWDEIKKYFVINQCERWISSINFSLMTVAGIILIIGITQGAVNPSSGNMSNSLIDNPLDSMKGGGNHWIFAFASCYVIARLILVSASLLTTNLNDKWLTVLPCATLQIFILGLIMTIYGSKIFGSNGVKTSVISFVVVIVLSLIVPFTILRIKPTTETENDISFKFGLQKYS